MNMATTLSQMDIRPKFEVEELEGEVERTIHYYEAKKSLKGKPVLERKTKTVKKPAGFMVYTSKGDSFRVETEEELQRLGMRGEAPMVDMATGEVVPQVRTSLKDRAERRVKTAV